MRWITSLGSSSCWKIWLAVCAALMAEPALGHHAHAMQLAAGSYTGNGAATRPVTGVGFRPDAVLIKGNANQYAVLRTGTMTGDATKELAAGASLQSKRIQSLDAGGFTIGNHAEVNKSGVVYSWVAFKDDGAGDFRVGSYVGSGADDRSINGLGFQPAYVIVMSAGAQRAVQRSSVMAGDSSVQFDSAGAKSNYIEALRPDGFQVGSDARVNAASTTYHYAAWKAVDGSMSVGSYTGNGMDNRSITGAGFRPDYVIVKALANEPGVHRTATPSGDSTLLFSASANVTNAIQGMAADGFQVGSASSVNGSKSATYFWMAFRATAAVSPATALAISSVNGGAPPTAGIGFSVVVQSRDSAGVSRNVTSATGIQLSLEAGSGALAGTLAGTIPAGASQATISGVRYTTAESGVALTATRTSGDALAPGDSALFTVNPGAIAGYALSLASPQSAGAPFEITATAQDQFANRVLMDSATLVTFSSASGHLLFDGDGDGTFGDATKALDAGSATINARGTLAESTTIAATDGNGKAGSASLTIIGGAPSTLAFITQPGNAPAGAPIPGPPTIAVQDDFGNTLSSSRAISVAVGANPGAGILGGTTTMAATGGIARFGDLTISKPGSGYTLTASSPGLTGALSSIFSIAAATGAMSGRVTRATDGAALAGATIDALQAGAVKGSATAGPDGAYTMVGLAPGVYDALASATGHQPQARSGITVTAGGTTTEDFGLTTLPGPSIRITSPAHGSGLTDPVVLVQGEVQAPAATPVGVAVNGVPGVLENGRFAALVPVDPSTAGLTAILNGLSGALARHTISVTVSAPTGEPQVQLQASPPGGRAPLTVTFHVSSLIGVSQIALDADGDGAVDFQGPALDGVSMIYQRPGVYVSTAQVTDTGGQAHTAFTYVHVLDAVALDGQLQAIWSRFKDAVRAGDVASASGFLHSSTRDALRAQLAALGPATLADIDQIMTSIQLVTIGFGGAQYEMLRQDTGQLLSFAVWFQIDEDGVWRLRRF